VVSFGFSSNESDKCIYSKFEHGKGVIIYLHVDDMIIFRTNLKKVEKTKCFLFFKFYMIDMGEVDIILGIKIIRDNNGIYLS